jgi:hypothetical protein
MTRKEIQDLYTTQRYSDGSEYIRSPGKFEGEAIYIPYFWDLFLSGCADEDDGEIIRCEISDEDRKEFPELGDRTHVYFFQREDGFVIECGPAGQGEEVSDENDSGIPDDDDYVS